MADRNGYIGRAPSDSAVTVARQTFSPTGVTTDFTFASGYVPGYFDIFINGVKMIEGSDYTSTDGSTFSVLNGGAISGDVIEGVAYKAFNAATIDSAPGNLSVGGNLTVTGIATLGAGTSVSFATTAYALEGTPDISVRNVTGVAATFTDIVTAQSGINIVGGGLTVTGVSTFFSDVSIADKIIHTGDTNTAIRFPAADTFTVETAGSEALRVDSSGRLLLGTTTEGAALADNFTVADSANCGITIRSGTTSYGSIYFSDATSGSGEYIGVIEYNHNTNVMSFNAGGGPKLKLNSTGEGKTADITGNLFVSGVATATAYHGSGANLTNLPASGDSNDITACLFI